MINRCNNLSIDPYNCPIINRETQCCFASNWGFDCSACISAMSDDRKGRCSVMAFKEIVLQINPTVIRFNCLVDLRVPLCGYSGKMFFWPNVFSALKLFKGLFTFKQSIDFPFTGNQG